MAHRHHHQQLHPHAMNIIHKLTTSNEQTWLLIGRVAEQMGDLEHALNAYEHALRHNPASVSGLTQVAGIARIKENYAKAVDYFQRVIQIEEDNGEIWSALGHCYLMQDDLQKAYSAYQQALYLLPNPKEDPKLWYGIGILYDRYGSLDHAEEAFTSVLRMCRGLDFDKENEILFRLGIIYKQQGKFSESLDCFDHILRNPPSPLALADIWFQIGHVFEQQKNYLAAKNAYERVVEANPGHAKVLQQLGWLYHQDGSEFQSQELAISYLTKSLEADPGDSQSWYLLGRAYMAGQKYNKAYEAYQQAVYRDGRNPTFWCSIGVLYFQINQYRDALDAYSRAIRINPYISEVWFDLGSLYESCNNQITDAIDAYARASELDPSNQAIAHRLQLLKDAQATGGQLPAAPGPQDVHPTAYASSIVPPPGLNGPPLMLHGNNRPPFRSDSRGPPAEIALGPAQSGRGSPAPPFKGGPPPPVMIDERQMQSHTPLAPMEVDRPYNSREYPPSRSTGGQSLLLQHPLPPQQQGPPPPSDDPRNGMHHPHDAYRRAHSHSRSISPQVPPPHMQHQRPMNGSHRSPSFVSYPPPGPGSRQGPPPGVGPAMPSGPPPRSPRSASYHRREPSEQDAWDRRAPSAPGGDHWDERRGPPPQQYQGPPPPHPQYAQQGPPPPPPVQMQQGPPTPQQINTPFYPPRSPRAHSPMEPSPRVNGYANGGSVKDSPLHEQRKYDPRMDAREYEEREIRERDLREREMMAARDREVYSRQSDRSYPVSPEGLRASSRPAHISVGGHRASESPMATPVLDGKRRRVASVKDEPPMQHQQFSPSSMTMSMPPNVMPESATKRRKRGGNGSGGSTNSSSSSGGRKEESVERRRYTKRPGSPADNASSGSARSVQPSPTSAVTPRPPSRVIEENYDDGVADVLMDLAKSEAAPSHSPTISSYSGRMSDPSPRPPPSHRNSISSNSHASPPPSSAGTSQPSQKRALSPAPDDSSSGSAPNKRSRMDSLKQPAPPTRRISSPSTGKRTPVPSTRPSPIPFRTQPTTSHSPEVSARVPGEPFSPPSPSLQAVTLPPHPRPIGAGHGSTVSASSPVIVQQGPPGVPSIATLPSSPPSSASSPIADRDEKMHMDVPSGGRGSVSPSMSGGARRSMGPPSSHGSASRSPTAMTMKQSQSPPSEKKEA